MKAIENNVKASCSLVIFLDDETHESKVRFLLIYLNIHRFCDPMCYVLIVCDSGNPNREEAQDTDPDCN